MYEFMCKCNAGIKTKYKLLFTIFVLAFCLVLASAMPLRVYASGLVMAELVNLIISALTGTFVATALATSGVYIIVALLAGMAASLTASMITQAIQAQVDNGNWARFLEQIKDSYSFDTSKKMLGMTMAKFLIAYDFVKNNIIGFFNEKIKNDSSVAFSPIFTIPTAGIMNYDYIVGGFPVIDYDLHGSTSTYYKFGYLLAQPYEELATIPFAASRQGSNGVVCSYEIDSLNPISNRQCHKMEIMFSEDFGLYLLRDYNFLNGRMLGNILLPYVEDYNTEKPKMYFRWNNSSWLSDEMQSANYLSGDMGYLGFIIDGNYYRVSANTTVNNQQAFTVENSSGQYQKILVDTPLKLNYAQLLYYIINGGSVKLLDSSNNEASTEKTSYSYTVVNNYYDTTKDIYKDVAASGASAIQSGAIAGNAVTDVSVGVSDTAATATEVTSATTVSDVATIEAIDTISGVSVPISTAFVIAGNNIKLGLSDIKYKFPFDVIYNSATWLQNLVREGNAPVIDYQLKNPLINNINVHIDFGKYQTVATVANWIILVSVAIGCLVNSRKVFNFFGGD